MQNLNSVDYFSIKCEQVSPTMVSFTVLVKRNPLKRDFIKIIKRKQVLNIASYYIYTIIIKYVLGFKLRTYRWE